MSEKELNLISAFSDLQEQLIGELYLDETMRKLYATDASAYRELPDAVAIPKSEADIESILKFANSHNTPIIPRTAGTSLAGQVVGKGIIVDVSKYFTKILETNTSERWVSVQPGVIRDELNMHLNPKGFLFGPETSTANRAMIGGMIGNNSCGSNSVVYGSTRDHLMSIKGYLSDGSRVEFTDLTKAEFQNKCELNTLEGNIYRGIKELLENDQNRKFITKEFPKPTIDRRNTGYAIDLLKDAFENGEKFNFCTLIAGSEGTLAFITEAKLAINPLPPSSAGLLCAHFESVYQALQANLIALKYKPYASELMDHYILERTKGNIAQRQNRFFLQGDPKAILAIDLRGESKAEVEKMASNLTDELKAANLGYHFPLVQGEDTLKVWSLRKAGLGLLSNIPGDAKPVPVIEDTAVDVNDLPDYIEEFNKTLKKYDLFCVHYAHAGSGEIHLRPIIDLKTVEGNKLFHTIAEEIARLVKKYRGSLSGEHGDGRLRGEFIPYMIGEHNYSLLKEIKRTWDPKNLLNPGKIVDTPSMNTSLRFKPGQKTKTFDTVLNFDENQGILRAAEQCNGSGDCRKTHLSGGTMCPSYMATKNEKDTTRARANILREVLTNSSKANPFDSSEIKDVMDLCLSCKGCKSECPSNVDVGKLKAEFQHQYQKENGVPFRTKLITNFAKLNRLAVKAPWLYKLSFNTFLAPLAKQIIGFHPKRSMPDLSKQTVRAWYKKEYHKLQPRKTNKGSVYFFCDEFTEYNDGEIGIVSIKLLHRLGYEVKLADHEESGRTFLSKGVLDKAKILAERNVSKLAPVVNEDQPLIGIEPSAILTFRDEYPDLVSSHLQDEARNLIQHVFTIEEFLASKISELEKSDFSTEMKTIKLHGHCHQKALSSLVPTKKLLSFPENYSVHLIPSGCCGMAGSFGYEKEHYDVSMNIGELVLFPTVRKQPEEVTIAAPGTSCRHQIKDGTGRKAKHPVEILYESLL